MNPIKKKEKRGTSLSIKSLLKDDVGYRTGNKAGDGAPLTNAAADVGAADINQRGVDQTHIGGQGCLVDGRILTRINDNGVSLEELVVTIPLGKTLPVVAANEQRELMLGIVG